MIKSLKNRVLAFFLIVSLTIVCTVFPLNYAYRKQDSANGQIVIQLNEVYIKFIKDLKNISEFLSYETTNPNFFITGESLYLRYHELVKDSLQETFNSWEKRNNIFSPLDKEKVKKIEQSYWVFCGKYDSIAYQVYKRGYRDLGIEGEMMSYMYQAEKNADFRKYTYELHRNERDYLNRNDSVCTAALVGSLERLNEKVVHSKQFNTEEKYRLLALLQNYRNSFNRLVAIDRLLGLKTNSGLRFSLLDQGNKLEKQIETELKHAREEEIFQATRLNTLFLVLAVLLLFCTIGLSNYLSRYLVSHLEKLSRYISQLAIHNFNYTDEKLSLRNASKEIREIYKEFRHMVAQLRIREKQRNDALADVIEKEQRYRELADLLPQGIFETDRLGNIIYANKAWYKAFGYSVVDIEDGLNLIEILHTNNENNLFGIDKVENSDYFAICKDSRRFPALVYSDTIVKEDKVIGRRGIIIDATLRNKYIETLQKETERAVNSDKLKSSFLANMSHEIRTPMNSIIGFSNLLSADQISKEQKLEFIKYIQSSGQLLLNLIDDIIDVAKIEAGEIKIKPAHCEPKKLILDLINTFEGYKTGIGKLDIDIRTKLPDNDIVFRTDPFRLRQIITNLVSNAIKFTEKGCVSITCEIKNDRFVEFSVEDTGIGMTKEEMNIVFSRFKRTNVSEEKNISGTGLGLSISKNLVELLGGQMWVSSLPGEGTRFWFHLPYNRIMDTGLITQKIKTTNTEGNYNWSGRTILVAEDDENSYIFLKEILQRSGATVIHAVNGKEAVDAVKLTRAIDLIMMDVQMPLLDGYAATREIKEIHPNLPIIAQTAYAMDGDKEKSILAGCDDYLTKPIDPGKLLDKISQFLPFATVDHAKTIANKEEKQMTELKEKK